MFELGDKVVHIRHGAGVVKERRKLTINGKEREYFCVEIEHGLSTLMIPIDQLNEGELRPAVADKTLIETVFMQAPKILESDYKIRQEKVLEDLRTMNAQLLAATLRDLSWLEKRDKLTSKDSQLKDRVMTELIAELALRPNLNTETAKTWLQKRLEETIISHWDKYNDSQALLVD